LAQDPIKVEPSHYRMAFENEHVVVTSVHYGPHEKSGLHEHPGGVVVSLTKAHLRFMDQNGHSQDVWAEPGEARWFPPVKHRVENLGDTPYNAVYIAIRKNAVAAKGAPATTDREAQKIVDDLIASAGH
jgi:quercetin dioxygenase-like cupin family protein